MRTFHSIGCCMSYTALFVATVMQSRPAEVSANSWHAGDPRKQTRVPTSVLESEDILSAGRQTGCALPTLAHKTITAAPSTMERLRPQHGAPHATTNGASTCGRHSAAVTCGPAEVPPRTSSTKRLTLPTSSTAEDAAPADEVEHAVRDA